MWGWLDACSCSSDDDDEDEDEDELVPIESPYEPGDPEYVDHVEEAVSRLTWQLSKVPDDE